MNYECVFRCYDFVLYDMNVLCIRIHKSWSGYPLHMEKRENGKKTMEFGNFDKHREKIF